MKGKREELENEIRKKENDLKNEKSPDVFQNGFLVFLTILSYVTLWFIRGMFGIDLRIFSLVFIGLLILNYLLKINKCNRLKEVIELKKNDLKLILDNEKLTRENNDKRQQEKLERDKKRNKEVKNEVTKKVTKFLSKFKTDINGNLEIVEVGDFSKILMIHQEKIIEINRDYIKQFVQVSNFLKTKERSIQSVFEILSNTIKKGGIYTPFPFGDEINFKEYIDSDRKLVLIKIISDTQGLTLLESKNVVDEYVLSGGFVPFNDDSVNKYFDILRNEINTLNFLFVYSLNMIDSLINNNMITFYEIYEKFDELNIFDSKHERDLKNQLKNLNNSLDEVMNQIQIMGIEIQSSIKELTTITEDSSNRIVSGLKSVESSIDTNNFISLIQTYQMYKVNKNTKR
jgi:hypothetical protein